MQEQLSPKENAQTGFWLHLSKWIITVPMFASLMVIMTNKSFSGNAIWEALRATGNSNIS